MIKLPYLKNNKMKRLLILILILGVGYASNAQLLTFKSTRSTSSQSNSFTNTAADTLDAFIGRVPATVTIKSVVTRASGTMAGKVYVYYATDAAKSYQLCDSVTLTNAATNTSYWSKSIAAPYWRLIRNGATTVTGTSAAKVSASQ